MGKNTAYHGICGYLQKNAFNAAKRRKNTFFGYGNAVKKQKRKMSKKPGHDHRAEGQQVGADDEIPQIRESGVLGTWGLILPDEEEEGE